MWQRKEREEHEGEATQGEQVTRPAIDITAQQPSWLAPVLVERLERGHLICGCIQLPPDREARTLAEALRKEEEELSGEEMEV